MTIVAILLFSAAVMFWLFKSKTQSTAQARHKRKKTRAVRLPGNLRNLYQAASINPGSCACSAAKALAETRFLADQAPRVPLGNCDSAKCQCRYVRHDDRRLREDRRATYCLQTDLYVVGGNKEHRSKRCRRRADKLTGAASDLNYNDVKWAV